MPEFDDEERSTVHLRIDHLLSKTKVHTVKVPAKPKLDPKARQFYGKSKTEDGNQDQSPMSVVQRERAKPKDDLESSIKFQNNVIAFTKHEWVTVSKSPFRRRCAACRCILTVFQTGPATYQLPGDDVTTRIPECKS
jgi:hypothetical protein